MQFGAFSLAYVTYGFAINASRGVAIDPILIRFSGTDLPTWRRAAASCTGTAGPFMGLITGACALVVGQLLGGTTGLAFLALGLTLPGLLLQDRWRYAFFALGRGHHAFINDAIWALILFPALTLLHLSGRGNVFWFVLAWGAAATVGAAIFSLQARLVPSLEGVWEWLWRHRDIGPRYLAVNTGGNAAEQLRTYTVSAILGVAAVGYLQAARTLMGPFMVVFFGMSLMAIPEAAQILRRSPRHLPLFCAAVSGRSRPARTGVGIGAAGGAAPGTRAPGCWATYGDRPIRWCCPATVSSLISRHIDQAVTGASAGRHARPGGRAPQPARHHGHNGPHCRLCRPRSRDRRHARHDVFCRRRDRRPARW